jgi:L-ascorbate metabolism protein UlaG (beta-lactamase superfamily)
MSANSGEEPVASGTARVWWMSQGTFVFEGPKSGPLVVDPYFSDPVRPNGEPVRLHPSPVAPGDLRVSAIFLTHDHDDHTDPKTLPALHAANPDAPIYAPLESIDHLERMGISGPIVHRLERGQTVRLPGVMVTTVHAEHTADSVGLIFAFEDGPTIYHTGDTEYYEGIGEKAVGADLLAICINGRWGNMNIAQAVQVTQTVDPVEVLPMHWGLFAENTADPAEFVAALAEAGGTSARPIVLVPDGTARHLAVRRSSSNPGV